jgi:hypothetical protein
VSTVRWNPKGLRRIAVLVWRSPVGVSFERYVYHTGQAQVESAYVAEKRPAKCQPRCQPRPNFSQHVSCRRWAVQFWLSAIRHH